MTSGIQLTHIQFSGTERAAAAAAILIGGSGHDMTTPSLVGVASLTDSFQTTCTIHSVYSLSIILRLILANGGWYRGWCVSTDWK